MAKKLSRKKLTLGSGVVPPTGQPAVPTQAPATGPLPPGVEDLATKMQGLEQYLEGLGEHDRRNFLTILSLPNAAGIIARCPDQRYREMATLALAIRAAGKRRNE